jgi:hypothetical protein
VSSSAPPGGCSPAISGAIDEIASPLLRVDVLLDTDHAHANVGSAPASTGTSDVALLLDVMRGGDVIADALACANNAAHIGASTAYTRSSTSNATVPTVEMSHTRVCVARTRTACKRWVIHTRRDAQCVDINSLQHTITTIDNWCTFTPR